MKRVKGPRIEPPSVIDWLGTVNSNGQPALTHEQRKSRCFELAANAIVGQLGPALLPGAGCLLVHGSIGLLSGRIGHAWLLLPGGRLWEPIRARVYEDRAGFYHWLAAWDEIAYGRPAAIRLLNQHGHFGPWHREPAEREEESG